MIPALWNVSSAEYHADITAVSHSSLDDFRQSERLYYGRYVSEEIPRRKPTPEMEFGTAFHAYLLEPETFESRVAVAPDVNRRTNAGKAVLESFEARHAGKQIIEQEDMARLRKMADAVKLNPLARELLTWLGHVERSFRWEDPETGILCKARPDKAFSGGVFVDLKSARDPSPEGFARDAASFGYHRQHDFYCRGAAIALEIERPQFLFVAVGKEEPFDVFVYQLHQEAEDLGERENNALLRRLKWCRDNDQWGSRQDEPIKLSLPRWAFTQGMGFNG